MIETLEKMPQVRRKITKAKLAKNGGVEVEFEQTIVLEKIKDGLVNEFEIKGEEISKREPFPHEDLTASFKMMRVHLALVADQLDGKAPNLHALEDDNAFLDLFTVTSFSIGGDGDDEGVTLTGNKKISRGKIINLNTPFTKFHDDNDPYDFATELKYLIDHTCGEVELYLDGKIAPDAQLSIEFNASEEGNSDME